MCVCILILAKGFFWPIKILCKINFNNNWLISIINEWYTHENVKVENVFGAILFHNIPF